MNKIVAPSVALFLLSCSRVIAEPSDPSANERTQHSYAAFLPTVLYKHEVIHGFSIFTNPAVLQHALEAEDLRTEIDNQLAALKLVAPTNALTFLRRVPIWVEWESRKENAAEFHVSVVWLKANGYNPEKVFGVEITNTKNFIDWSRNGQPWMILHELSHAYYHQVLSWRWNEVKVAYDHAIGNGLYNSVPHINGGRQTAYAQLNQDEYFAEISEAYFGQNDFFPFTRSELEDHDPQGYELMLNTWGELQYVD